MADEADLSVVLARTWLLMTYHFLLRSLNLTLDLFVSRPALCKGLSLATLTKIQPLCVFGDLRAHAGMCVQGKYRLSQTALN